jgi:hypothetical protein
MLPPIAIGRSDFAKLRQEGCLYVDKSQLIVDVVHKPVDVQLYPRPRRFGKTLGMTMLRYFFERGEDHQALFSDLAVWQDAKARQHFNRHPVIYLTFKDVKHLHWSETKQILQSIIASELIRLSPLWDVPSVHVLLRQDLQAIMEKRAEPLDMLLKLSQALHQATGESVVLLMDEYDAPILTAWQYGYYDEVAGWFRAFLSNGLKDNNFLFRAVLTGILRVAKESMFSGLNNVEVYSLLRRGQQESFGFRETEVMTLLAEAGRSSEETAVRDWYNGYRFGGTQVYNPWSILNVLAHPEEFLCAWWLNTSDNALVRELLLDRTELSTDIESLLRGIPVEREIKEDVPLRDLRGTHVWSLLLFSGYLRADAVRVEEGEQWVTLSIPNKEVRSLWRNTFTHWLQSSLGNIAPFHRALLEGNAAHIESMLTTMLLLHTSSHDVKQNQDEAFYHAFVLGLLVSMEKTHTVRSNREVGYGRSDVLITPKIPGLPGVVLEFKKLETGRTLSGMAEEALRQIDREKYATELEAAGVFPIRKIGISFTGKQVAVRCAHVEITPQGLS